MEAFHIDHGAYLSSLHLAAATQNKSYFCDVIAGHMASELWT